MDRIVITTQEVDKTVIPAPTPQGSQQLHPRLPRAVPIWVILLMSPLVLILPLLCLAALIIRLSIGRKTPRAQQAWISYLLTMLIVSGLLSTVLSVLSISFSWAPAPDALGAALSNLDERSAFPELPAGKIMSGVELSSTLKPLVLLASPTEKRWFQSSPGASGLLGAAMILETNSHGYLLATARHVADGEGWQTRTGSQKVMVSDGMNGWATARVVGRHKHFDLALLWLDRASGEADFRQSIATYSSVQAGEKIYVIGHPEGLNFTVSNGIVSRTPGQDVLQLSAPISPGNSGGPVYDEFGNLLAVVTSKVARSREPEAENLNFAISTDALLHKADWNLVKEDKVPADFLDEFVRNAKVRGAANEKTAQH